LKPTMERKGEKGEKKVLGPEKAFSPWAKSNKKGELFGRATGNAKKKEKRTPD